MITLTDGKLLVNGEMNDIYEVALVRVTSDMMAEVELTPNQYSIEIGVESEYFTFDPLNETLVACLSDNGYRVIKPSQVKSLQI